CTAVATIQASPASKRPTLHVSMFQFSSLRSLRRDISKQLVRVVVHRPHFTQFIEIFHGGHELLLSQFLQRYGIPKRPRFHFLGRSSHRSNLVILGHPLIVPAVAAAD